MQCTPAEIERKRQEALRKLANKNKSPNRIQRSPFDGFEPGTVSPIQKFPGVTNVNHYSKPYDRSVTDRSNKINKPISQFYSKDAIITASCILQTDSRFTVEFSTFSSPAIEIFKTISSRNYGKLDVFIIFQSGSVSFTFQIRRNVCGVLALKIMKS